MARGKLVKVDYKGVKAEYKNGELVGTIESSDEETEEITITELNLTSEIKDVLKSLKEDEKISINVKKFSSKPFPPRKQLFQYECVCGKKIKSEFEGLDITCNDCQETFIMKVKENE